MSEFKNLPSGWKVVRLGEISSRVTRRNQDNRCQNVLTISAQSGLINQVDFFNKQVASKDLSNYILLKKGEFAYNKSYSTGYSFGAFKRLKFYEEGVASPLYIYFKFNDDVCSDFFEFYFDAGQANRQIKDIVQEGARNHGLLNLSIDDFFNIKIRMPNLDEQKKIAEILSTWDEAINLTINLIESKKQFKKALMQNLLTAKINWHTTTLSNVGEIITGSTPSTTNEKFWNGEVAWITPTDIGDKKDIFIGERSITQDGLKATRELPANSLLVTCIASIGKNAVLKVKGSCNQQINALIPNKNFNVDFLYYLLEFEKEKLKKLAGITATLIISKALFSKFKISFPDITEQQKIAKVLTACDDEINLLNLKLENLKKQKQSLMQKLLSGKVRI